MDMDPPDPPDAFEAAAAAAAAASAAQSSSNSSQPSSKRNRSSEPTAADFYMIGRDIQNRSDHRVGAELSEDQRFREFFGCSAEVALKTWRKLVKYDLVPEGGEIKHFIWSLFFMKLYPLEKPSCALAGGSGGAVDPKTLRKYIWPMIRNTAMLEQYLVSQLSCMDRFCARI